MIGQTTLLQQLKTQPHKVNLIVGRERSGKKTLIKELFNYNKSYIVEKTSVDTIKLLYDYIYTNKLDQLCFADIDKSSVNAQNMLLKLIEDFFNSNTTIYLTCSNITKIPQTIISRCTIYYMQPYSKEELLQYSDNIDYCATIGDVNELNTYNIDNFKLFINKIVSNVNIIQLYNFFKIEEQIQVVQKKKQEDIVEDQKYDLFLTLNGVCEEALKKELYQLYYITSKYINQLSSINISKKQLLWNWIIEVKEYYNDATTVR